METNEHESSVSSDLSFVKFHPAIETVTKPFACTQTLWIMLVREVAAHGFEFDSGWPFESDDPPRELDQARCEKLSDAIESWLDYIWAREMCTPHDIRLHTRLSECDVGAIYEVTYPATGMEVEMFLLLGVGELPDEATLRMTNISSLPVQGAEFLSEFFRAAYGCELRIPQD